MIGVCDLKEVALLRRDAYTLCYIADFTTAAEKPIALSEIRSDWGTLFLKSVTMPDVVELCHFPWKNGLKPNSYSEVWDFLYKKMINL